LLEDEPGTFTYIGYRTKQEEVKEEFVTTLPVYLKYGHVRCGTTSKKKKEDGCDWYINLFVG
jgi:hypothetical protein